MAMDRHPEPTDLRFMSFFYGLTAGLSTLVVVLVLVWIFQFRGGFGWSDDVSLQFNWHPFLMVLSLVIFYGHGILVYRLMRNEPKKKLKLLHAGLMMLSLLGASVGLKAVFDSHNYALKPIPNLYSLHSWVGLAGVIMFALQWVCGFISFLFPGLRYTLRAAYMPLHVFGGLMLFVITTFASVMGFLEKSIFINAVNPMSSEGALMNCIGVAVIALAGVIMFMATRVHYKRQPMPEDELLLADQLAE